jgi:O-antigen ligase
MELVLLILVVAAATWWAVYARHGSLLLGCGGLVALGYVLGPPLWSSNLGPIPLTVDRLLLLGLGATGAWHWRQGRLCFDRFTAADWLLLVTVAYFTIRCALTPEATINASAVKPWWRLIAAFWVPAALYAAARTAPMDERRWRGMLWIFAALGAYLAFTALAEISKQWWAVFPRYIADPTLGTHFGRARGPALNSASLGIMLTICFWAAWLLWPRLHRISQLALVGLLGSIAVAVFFTYTRSTWIGLAGGLAVIPLVLLPNQWRGILAIGVVMIGAFGVAVLGERITDLGRKDGDGSAEHSVYQRASFVYVSMRMFRDAPVFGQGFSRFYDKKMPYLADRSQQLELESLRKLDHHNTFLSVLVETGFVGFALFMSLLVAWGRAAWRLTGTSVPGSWPHGQGLFALATLIAYASSALFHDLTLSATEHWLPFLVSGMSIALLARRGAATSNCGGAVGLACSSTPQNRPDQAWSGLAPNVVTA